MDVVPTLEWEGETHVHIHVLGRVLGHIRVLGLDHALGPPGMPGGAILMNPRGMAGTVEGAEEGLGLVEEAEGEVVAVDIVKPLGLVLHHPVGVPDPCADGHQATNVGGMEGAGRGRLHTLFVPVVHGRDLTPVPVPVPHVLAQERAPCLTLLTRDIAGAGAGVARVLGL